MDLHRLQNNIENWITRGVTGVVVVGSTSDRVYLNEREYEQVIATSPHAVRREFAFIVGAGQQSAVSTIDEIRRAAEAAADAVLVITPSFYRSALLKKHSSNITMESLRLHRFP